MGSAGLRTRLGARHLVVGGLVVVVVAVATLAVLSGGSSNGPTPPSGGPTSGKLAPLFSLASLQGPGPTVSLGSPDGRATVITFFASWCTDCRKDIGVLAASSRQLGNRVDFVGVDVADTRSAALALVHSVNLDYPVGLDPSRAVSSRFQLPGLPSAVFVNGSGHVVHTVVGAITPLELTDWIGRAAA